jgi:hypothetical protein
MLSLYAVPVALTATAGAVASFAESETAYARRWHCTWARPALLGVVVAGWVALLLAEAS